MPKPRSGLGLQIASNFVTNEGHISLQILISGDRHSASVPIQQRPVSLGIHDDGILRLHLGILAPVQPLRQQRQPILLVYVPGTLFSAVMAFMITVTDQD